MPELVCIRIEGTERSISLEDLPSPCLSQRNFVVEWSEEDVVLATTVWKGRAAGSLLVPGHEACVSIEEAVHVSDLTACTEPFARSTSTTLVVTTRVTIGREDRPSTPDGGTGSEQPHSEAAGPVLASRRS